ncbi:hypothetical protein [Tsuneonella suprasediminis]|uniref:hypothetical protein n=1 Tax=Tsuneonella suprasediminis TaxID=2306996 RepID=UPI002F93021E
MTSLSIDWELVALVYASGVPAWCFVMSLMGERRDWDYILAAFLWPMMALSLLGQIVRKVFR